MNTTSSDAKRVNKSDIQPRRMSFKFNANIPTYWFDDSQFKSTLLTALSCTFPEGERFFVRAVRHYQPHIKNPLLQEAVKGFIGQEAHHGNEHEQFNILMESKGFSTKKVSDFVLNGLGWQEKNMSPARRLAKTCALEHFTAMLAEQILENPQILDGMEDSLRPLWLWHAIEEEEHKAVAFDVFQEQVDNYWIRTSEMALTTVEFIGFTAFHYTQLRKNMQDKRDWKSIADGFSWLFSKPGVLRKTLPTYLSYYRRDFHPNERQKNQARLNALQQLATMLKRPELKEYAA